MLQLAVMPLLQHSFHLRTCIFLTDDSRMNKWLKHEVENNNKQIYGVQVFCVCVCVD
jgi:hypothetical protein